MSFPGYPALDSGPLDLTLDAYNDSRFNQATVKETCRSVGDITNEEFIDHPFIMHHLCLYEVELHWLLRLGFIR